MLDVLVVVSFVYCTLTLPVLPFYKQLEEEREAGKGREGRQASHAPSHAVPKHNRQLQLGPLENFCI